MSVRILLADDHRILREGLRSLLAQQPDMVVVGEAADGEEAVALAGQLRPDLVIMDVVMPGLDGVAATRRIRAEIPATRVIALSMHADRRFVSEMLRAGALGYLLKDSAFEELHQAVRTVMDGRPYLSAVITGSIVEDFVRQTSAPERSPASPLEMLTAREWRCSACWPTANASRRSPICWRSAPRRSSRTGRTSWISSKSTVRWT